MKNKDMSILAKALCVNPSDPTEGLKKKKSGAWELVKSFSIDGERNLKSFSSADPCQVWEKYAEFLRDIEELEYRESTKELFLSKEEKAIRKNEEDKTNPLFKDVADRYLDDVYEMKHGTQKVYIPAAKRAIEEFGEMRMKDIQHWQIKDFLTKFAKSGRGRTTVLNQKTVINAIFKTFVEEWHGDYNPTALVSPPKGLKKNRRNPPSEKEVAAVIEASERDKVEPDDLIPILLLSTGFRKGEACAVRLMDIDFKNKVISIDHAVEWIGDNPHITVTKTEAGARKVPLLHMLEKSLTGYRDLPPETYIVGLSTSPVKREWYKKHWLEWWKARGFAVEVERRWKRYNDREGKVKEYTKMEWKPTVSSHQFRHEYVCMLCEAGVKEEIAIQIVGHANTKMVHEVYMHLKPSMLNDAGKLLDHILG